MRQIDLDTIRSRYDKLISIRKHPNADLYVLNYTPKCQYERHWDGVTMQCRGLIVTGDGTIVGQPFPKFFNIGEVPETQPENLPSLPFRVFEKVDGSLGISYWLDGKLHLATRGSFDSEQALRGTEMLSKLPVNLVSDHWTLLFEIVYSENKSVIQYDFDGLVLLAIYDYVTGKELPNSHVHQMARKLKVRTPKEYPFYDLRDVAASAKVLDSNTEGFVIRFQNGLRVKLKGEAYLQLHRIVWQLSEKRIAESLRDGTYTEFLVTVPEELRPQVEEMAQPLIDAIDTYRQRATELFAKAPKDSRKEFALWVMSNATDVRPAMFMLYDRKEVNWAELALKEKR